MRCSRAQRLIRRTFVEQALPASRVGALWSHLSRCDRCRARYDQVLSLERLLESQGQSAISPSPLELSLVRGLALAAARPEPDRVSSIAGFGPLLRLSGAVAAVLIAVVIGVLLWPRPDVQTFQARHAGQPGLGVRALCALADVRGELLIRSLSSDPGPQELASCPTGARLRFAYVAPRPGYLYAWSGSSAARMNPLLPPSADAPAARVPASAQLRPVEVTLRPADAAADTPIVVVFVLSEVALDPTQRAEAMYDVLSGAAPAVELSAVVLRIPIDEGAP